MLHQEIKLLSRSISRSHGHSQPSDTDYSSESSAPTSMRSVPSTYQKTPKSNNLTTAKSFINIAALTSSVSTNTDTNSDVDSASQNHFYTQASIENCVPRLCKKVLRSKFRVTNSANFNDYFPSSRLMKICHDTREVDGHLNLRVETDHLNRHGPIQLFHLCIKDLEKRKFSLRRYERASGREVCKTARKRVPATSELPQSPLTAWENIKLSSAALNIPSLFFLQKSQRRYGERHRVQGHTDTSFCIENSSDLVITNITRLYFSNYAQVWIKQCVTRFSNHYNFEYWGYEYFWKRRVRKRGAKNKKVSYHLYRTGEILPIAHIIPQDWSGQQKFEQLQMANWIPPCNFWIAQPMRDGLHCDVAE